MQVADGMKVATQRLQGDYSGLPRCALGIHQGPGIGKGGRGRRMRDREMKFGETKSENGWIGHCWVQRRWKAPGAKEHGHV